MEALEHYATHPERPRVKRYLESLRIVRHQDDYVKD
ncbi:hypothetical protein PQQ51_31340 [Paraburkholderia xenovorans]